MATTGEARRGGYRPGERVPETLPVDEGTYELALGAYEKGERGWKSKPGKFPSKKVSFNIVGTEDEVTGGEKRVTEYVSLSPKISWRVLFLAQAAAYPEEFDLPKYGEKEFTSPKVREAAHIVDAILSHIEESGAVLRANLGTEEYNGRTTNRIQKWLAPDEVPAEEAAETEPEEATSAFGDSEESPAEEPEDEVPARPTHPVKPGPKVVPLGTKKPAAKKPGRR